MAFIELNAEQIVEIIRALPDNEQKRVFDLLQPERDRWWQDVVSGDDTRLRRLAQSRGVDWDSLDDAGRESFIDDLLYGDA